MPAFVAALWGAFISILGTVVGKVLVSLGIGYVSYTALDAGFSAIKAQVASSFGGLAAQSLAVLSACQVGSAVAIIFSAIAARMVLDGITGGTLKRMVLK